MTKTAFCFTGEGARGSIQAGIAYGLTKSGISPDITVGISSGSVCASSYAYLGHKGLVDLWGNIRNIFDVFGLNYLFFMKNGLLNQKPMEKIVKKATQNKPICESVVSSMNIETGEMKYVSNYNVTSECFAENILSSVAITGLVEDRNGWVDAGSRQLAPVKQCIDYGCKEIYVIMGRPLVLSPWKKTKGFMNAAKMSFRALDITLYEMMLRDIESSLKQESSPEYKDINIYLIEPKKLLFDSVFFSKCKEGVEYGKTEYNKHDKKGLKNFFNLI